MKYAVLSITLFFLYFVFLFIDWMWMFVSLVQTMHTQEQIRDMCNYCTILQNIARMVSVDADRWPLHFSISLFPICHCNAYTPLRVTILQNTVICNMCRHLLQWDFIQQAKYLISMQSRSCWHLEHNGQHISHSKQFFAITTLSTLILQWWY